MDTEDIFWILTKFAVYSFIYVFGRFYYDISWFVPLFFTALRDYAKRKHELRMAATQCALKMGDRDAVLARLDRLDEIPAWVLFPDLERAEWLNLIIKRFWPNLNGMVVNQVKIIENKLSSSLTNFKFIKVELGNVSPRITGIKVYDKNIPDRDLIIDLNLCYFGDCELIFSLNGIEGGIKNIEAEGAMRVILKPLMSDVPHIGVVQIYFLRHPVVNFELTSALAMLDMFSTGDLIRSVLKDQIEKALVYPNKINIKLCPKANDLSFKMPIVDGIVKIKIEKVFGISERQIFINASLGSETIKSEIVEVDGESAAFNEEFNLISYMDGDDKVEVVLSGVAEGGKVTEIGRKSIGLAEIKLNKKLSETFTFDSTNVNFSAHLTWLKVTEDKEENHLGLLQIYIDSIRSIDPKFRPYIKITVGDVKKEASLSSIKNDFVSFKNHLNFLVENPEEKKIEFKIVDQISSVEIGEFNYNIADLIVRKNFEQELQSFSPVFSLVRGHDCEIILGLKLNLLKIAEN